ncbi:MAG TPA: hypothetical protein VMY35_07600 [Phycisphaerae bacterium]|nr:hypothetical protein [Phycisphaerae bacterium]
MDIIITTPKREMANAAREAEDCKRDGDGEYFRQFPINRAPWILPGQRVFYVEDGFIRGFARVVRVHTTNGRVPCATTGRLWPAGFYVFMDATTWTWIRPIPKKGFRGFRYAGRKWQGRCVVEVGGWLDPKPEVEGGGA